ncbi:MAG: efflux RND transporter periplasmic adaptor subunit [Spongiibacteraceae bacterium]
MTTRNLLFSLLLTTLLVACNDETPPMLAPPAVTVVTLQAEDVTLTRELPGRVASSRVAEIRPQVTGILQRRLFTEGSHVEAGEGLYQIEDASYRAEVNSARAALARAEAALTLAQLTAKRSAELVKVNAISTQDNENAIAVLSQAKADVNVAKAHLEASSVTLGYTLISSPISGRIGKSNVTEGALVTANQETALATVQQLDPVYIDVTRSGSELLQLRQQFAAGTLKTDSTMPVTLLLEDGSRYPHNGELAFSEVSVDPSTGSYALRINMPNPDQILMPGMYLRAVVAEGVRTNAVLAPQQGITRDPKGNATAMVLNQDNKVELRNVTVSRTIGDKWLVEDGLASGDKLIVEGLQKIQPGMVVAQVTERNSAATLGQNADAITSSIAH